MIRTRKPDTLIKKLLKLQPFADKVFAVQQFNFDLFDEDTGKEYYVSYKAIMLLIKIGGGTLRRASICFYFPHQYIVVPSTCNGINFFQPIVNYINNKSFKEDIHHNYSELKHFFVKNMFVTERFIVDSFKSCQMKKVNTRTYYSVPFIQQFKLIKWISDKCNVNFFRNDILLVLYHEPKWYACLTSSGIIKIFDKSEDVFNPLFNYHPYNVIKNEDGLCKKLQDLLCSNYRQQVDDLIDSSYNNSMSNEINNELSEASDHDVDDDGTSNEIDNELSEPSDNNVVDDGTSNEIENELSEPSDNNIVDGKSNDIDIDSTEASDDIDVESSDDIEIIDNKSNEIDNNNVKDDNDIDLFINQDDEKQSDAEEVDNFLAEPEPDSDYDSKESISSSDDSDDSSDTDESDSDDSDDE